MAYIKMNNWLIGLVYAFFLFKTIACHVHSDKPLMLLVSFDGFRWDYLKMYSLKNFEYFKSVGSHAEFINNSFATVTFPNHWTIVTGLYEESHGIVQNSMYDPVLKEVFSHFSSESQSLKWYGQNKVTEPIWVTNQKGGNGRRSAAEWLGSNVLFENQTIVHIPYNKSTPYEELVDKFVQMFTDAKEPINFGALYFDEPDHTGHIFGPYSTEMKEKLEYLDQVLGYMIEQLKSHHLFDKLNVIITSDHGMEAIYKETAIFLDSHIDINLFDAYGSRAAYSIFVKNASDIGYVYKTLKTIANIDVFKKDEIPENLHYKYNVRLGDMVIVTRLGYGTYIFNQTIDWSINKGDHGFYNNESSMHPIFMAHGPAFRKNFTIPTFNNVDIYPLMCFILEVKPGVNNGSLENVIDMVVFNPIETRSGYMFLLLSLIPIALVAVTSLSLCSLTSNGSTNRFITNPSHGAYATIASSDTTILIDAESDDDDDSPTSAKNKTSR